MQAWLMVKGIMLETYCYVGWKLICISHPPIKTTSVGVGIKKTCI